MNFKQNQRNRYQFFSILFQLALASNNNALRFFNKKKEVWYLAVDEKLWKKFER